jgi:hypothetical protein
MESVARLHGEQIELFRKEAEKLGRLFEDAPEAEILFGGTMVVHSGRAVAMIAPLRYLPPRTLVEEGGLVGVLWLTPGSRDSRLERKLRAGIYALQFVPVGREGAKLNFVGPNGRVAHSVPGILMLARGKGGLWDEIKKLLKKFGLDINVVDVEILFPGGKTLPSEVRVSVLFFSFHLFDDP